MRFQTILHLRSCSDPLFTHMSQIEGQMNLTARPGLFYIPKRTYLIKSWKYFASLTLCITSRLYTKWRQCCFCLSNVFVRLFIVDWRSYTNTCLGWLKSHIVHSKFRENLSKVFKIQKDARAALRYLKCFHFFFQEGIVEGKGL